MGRYNGYLFKTFSLLIVGGIWRFFHSSSTYRKSSIVGITFSIVNALNKFTFSIVHHKTVQLWFYFKPRLKGSDNRSGKESLNKDPLNILDFAFI